MAQPPKTSPQATDNAALVLSDGSVFFGRPVGASGISGGELCFNTGMTGYQEVISDPSYTGQIITFTFPHIGNVGTNELDMESARVFAKGVVLRADITAPSNHRSERHFNDWLTEQGVSGICNVDTRRLTQHLRDKGHQNAVIVHGQNGTLDLAHAHEYLASLPDMTGQDLAASVSTAQTYVWNERNNNGPHIVVIDYGVKRNILRSLEAQGFRLTVVPAALPASDILALKPDGIFLSNGPGDPAATGRYALPIIQQLLAADLPLFGICLGHQLLALALGARTAKMPAGHRGTNHPVKNLLTGCVEITSQNHGFHVVADSLPAGVEATHISLFDNTNEGLRLTSGRAFSVQYHPEASPGPHDSHYLFGQFHELVIAHQQRQKAAA